MEGQINWQIVAVLVAVGAILGPGLVCLGVWIATIRSSCKSAHHRIDRVEVDMSSLVGRLERAVERALKSAWRNCPLATKSEHDGE